MSEIFLSDIEFIRKYAGPLDEEDEADLENGSRCTIEALLSIAKYNKRTQEDKDHKDMTINEFFEKIVESTEQVIADELDQLDMNELIQEKEKFESLIEHEQIDASYQVSLVQKSIERKDQLTHDLNEVHQKISDQRKINKDKEDERVAKVKELDLIRSNINQRIDQLQKQFNDEYIRPDRMNENQSVRYRNLSNIMNNNIKKLKEDIDHNHKRMETELQFQKDYDSFQDELSHLFIDEHLINYKLKRIDKKSNLILTEKRSKAMQKLWKEETRLRSFYLQRKNIRILDNRQRNIYLVTNMNHDLINKLVNNYPKMIRSWEEGMTRFKAMSFRESFKQGIESAFDEFHQYEKVRKDKYNDQRILIVCNINMIPPDLYDQNNVLFLDDGRPENWFKKINYYVHRKNEVQKKSIYYVFYELEIMKFLLYEMYVIMNVKH